MYRQAERRKDGPETETGRETYRTVQTGSPERRKDGRETYGHTETYCTDRQKDVQTDCTGRDVKTEDSRSNEKIIVVQYDYIVVQYDTGRT
jgi:hypothetical protein